MKAGEKKTRQMGDRSFRCMVWMYKIADFVHLANPRKRLEKAGLKEGMVIVDYGCGPGRYAIPSAETVGARGRVFAVDVQPLAVQMVKQKAARKSLSNVEAILLDSYATPVEASIVDRVLLIDTLHLIDDCGELFREIRRLLRPDGAIFMDPGHMKAEKAKAIIEEIKYIKERYGIKELLFYDDTFTLSRERIIKLCDEMIKNEINIPWSCETRVNLVDRELLSKMKSAGCYIISYGVESGNQEILNIIKKDISIEQVKNAFKITRDLGIIIVSYFMLGCPGDTEQTMKQTIEFAKELDANFTQFSICTPFPGTEIANFIKQENIDWNKFTYVSNRSEMIPFVLSKHLTREQLKKWYNKAYKEFYLRPMYLLKTILRTRSTGDIKVNINGIKMFLNILK